LSESERGTNARKPLERERREGRKFSLGKRGREIFVKRKSLVGEVLLFSIMRVLKDVCNKYDKKSLDTRSAIFAKIRVVQDFCVVLKQNVGW
jgi:hypothetical protein